MEADRLFLAVLDDLRSRTGGSASEYEMLGAARLLRQLLLDDHPLVDQVNRRHQLKLRYRITGESDYERMVLAEHPVFWTKMDGLDPDTAMPMPNRPVIEVGRDGLLAARVMVTGGREISVKDLILHAANVAGGIHRGDPRTKAHQIVEAVARDLQVGGLPSGLRDLQAIGRVVLKGLAPLEAACRSIADSAPSDSA